MSYVFFRHTEKMLRRMKDELSKAKNTNEELQNEVSRLRDSPSGSRMRNGRTTPGSDDHTVNEVLRNHVAELEKQNQRFTQENMKLHQRLEANTAELDRLKDLLMNLQQEADERQLLNQELEEEIDRLKASLAAACDGQDETLAEKLQSENAQLRRENDQLSHRVHVLLDGQMGFGNRPLSDISEKRASQNSDDNVMNLESLSQELETWQRRMTSDTQSHNRRPSEQGSEPPNGHSERTQSRP